MVVSGTPLPAESSVEQNTDLTFSLLFSHLVCAPLRFECSYSYASKSERYVESIEILICAKNFEVYEPVAGRSAVDQVMVED